MDIDQAEAILRTEMGSKVSTMGSKELKRDLLLFARRSPYLFLQLATDENVQLRNVAIMAAENGPGGDTARADGRPWPWLPVRAHEPSGLGV